MGLVVFQFLKLFCLCLLVSSKFVLANDNSCLTTSQNAKTSVSMLKDITNFTFACHNCIKVDKFSNSMCEKITDSGDINTAYVVSDSYGIFGAKNTNKEIIDKLGRCPTPNMSCPSGLTKKTPPSIIIESLPTVHENSPNCASLKQFVYNKTFSKNAELSDCQQESANWVENIIRNKNKEGKALANGCPDECSFYTSMNISNPKFLSEKCSISTRVQIICGPPKTKSKWVSKGKLLLCEGK